MLTQFISQDLSKRSKKLSTSRGQTVRLVLPINFIRNQKEITKKISSQCESTYSQIEGLRSDVTFIKKEIQIDIEKKKRNKRARITNFSSVKQNKPSKKLPINLQSESKSPCQAIQIKRKLSSTCMTNSAFKEENPMASAILYSKRIFPEQKANNK